MQRYFSNNKENNIYTLSNDDSYHITKVMRMKLNDKIEIVDNMKTFICKIIAFNPVKSEIIEELQENNENIKKIIVIQSLVNENKMDLILQKCSELGMDIFIPFKAKNSVIKENDKIDKKVVRWQRIVKEACEQSKRNIIASVENPVNLEELCHINADLKILLSVNEMSKNIKNVLQKEKSYDTIIIVVGPEGGFTKDEEERLIAAGYIRTSLGKRVLRTETASIVTLSMINYEWMV
jgi:16S rRNA (uracil1498-N3)-methyltransferase